MEAARSARPAPRRALAGHATVRVAVSSAAPASLVAVPTTRAPAAARARAMAWPMPREAPVTSATSFSSMLTTPSCRTLAPVAASAAADVARSSSARQARSARRSMRRLRPVSTLPGPHSMSCAMAVGRQRAHGVLPAHRARQLPHQQCADVIRLLMRGGIHRADVADRGLARAARRAGAPQSVAPPRPIRLRVRGHAHRQHHGALGTRRLAGLDGALDRGARSRRSPPVPGH